MLKISSKGAPVIDRLTYEVLAITYAEIASDLNAVSDSYDFDSTSATGRLIAALKEKCEEKSYALLDIASEIKPGRPKNRIAGGIINSHTPKPKRPPGRPRKEELGSAVLIYKIVESQRQVLAKQGKKATIVAAIDSLNESLATSKEVRAHSFKNSARNSSKALYNRGKIAEKKGM